MAPKLVHLSTNYVFDGAREEPYGEGDLPAPRSVYAHHRSSPASTPPWPTATGALVVRGAGLYGLHGSASKGGNFVQRMLARARGRRRPEDGGRPAPAAHVHGAIWRPRSSRPSIATSAAVLHLTASGACSWFDFTRAIMDIAAVDVDIEPVQTTSGGPGSVDRPLNGVLARPRADALGLTPLRSWREALEDYMGRAGLAAAPA